MDEDNCSEDLLFFKKTKEDVVKKYTKAITVKNEGVWENRHIRRINIIKAAFSKLHIKVT